jgi:DNA repair exonuclease SbcCD ATPase subunit
MRAQHLSRVATLLAALGLASGASAQSLAEIAAQQKEKRKGKPAKVFTEDDLKRGTSRGTTPDNAGAVVEGEAPATPAPGAAPASEQGASKSEDELRAEAQKAWRDQLQKSRDNAAQLSAEVDRLQTSLNDLAQPLYGSTRTNRLAALDKAKQQLATAQQTIVDLEEQGRRSSYR